MNIDAPIRIELAKELSERLTELSYSISSDDFDCDNLVLDVKLKIATSSWTRVASPRIVIKTSIYYVTEPKLKNGYEYNYSINFFPANVCQQFLEFHEFTLTDYRHPDLFTTIELQLLNDLRKLCSTKKQEQHSHTKH